jgi:hypothetical protein
MCLVNKNNYLYLQEGISLPYFSIIVKKHEILGKLVGLVIKKIYFHLQKDTTLRRFFAIE